MSDKNSAAGSLHLIRCDIGDETYGLDMARIRTIQRVDRLRWIPEARDPTASSEASSDDLHRPVGWLPTDEGDVPVFSLAVRLGRPSKIRPPEGELDRRGQLQRVIVLNPPRSLPQTKGGESWGLLVDRVSQVFEVSTKRVAPLPPVAVNPSKAFFTGVLGMGEELVLLLSPDQLHPDTLQHPERLSASGTGSPREGHMDGHAVSPSVLPGAGARIKRDTYGQILVFSIGEARSAGRKLAFGLSISQVPEVLEPQPRIPIPAAPDFVLGLINWRDRAVPLIDLATRLKMTSDGMRATDGKARLMVARDRFDGPSVPGPATAPDEHAWRKDDSGRAVIAGFLVQPAIQLLRLPIEHQRCTRELPLDRRLIRDAIEWGDETLVIPDMGGILSPTV